MEENKSGVTDYWVAVMVLSTQMALGLAALWFWSNMREQPDASGGGLAFVSIFFYPFLFGAGFLACWVVAFAVVMPTLVLARRLSRRFTRRPDVWWWVPPTAVVLTAPAPVIAAVCGTSAGTALWIWPLAAAGITAAALAARLARWERWKDEGQQLIQHTVGWGVAVVALTVFVCAIVLNRYEPPRLADSMFPGTWSDGHGGTLTLTADGHATLKGLARHDDFGVKMKGTCSGTGTWTFDRGTNPHDQEFALHTDCDGLADTWEVLGTREHPAVFIYLGDPDSWDLYTLRKQP